MQLQQKLNYPRGDSNPQSSVQETDALSIRPRRLLKLARFSSHSKMEGLKKSVLFLSKKCSLGFLKMKNIMLYIIMQKQIASPGNRTRVARMGILHDTTTPATQPQNSVKGNIYQLSSTARLAQSVEHETLNLRVVGSSPTLGEHFNITKTSFCFLNMKTFQCHSYGAVAQLVKAPVQ